MLKKRAIEEKDVGARLWKSGKELWNLLKKYIEGDARSLTKSTPNTNGWEAWRQICVYFEAGTGQRDAEARQEFANMNYKKAKKNEGGQSPASNFGSQRK